MRSIFKNLALLAAALMVMAVPALAAEGAIDKMVDHGQPAVKNECLLVAKNCGNQVDSIQERIERISGEIAKGTNVYSKDEMRRLERQLEEANKLLNEQSLGG